MDVDKLFKIPQLPTGSLTGKKRRLPKDPNIEASKRSKVGSGDALKYKVTVEDEGPADIQTQEQEPQFAPGNDADYFAEEDEEGRFYGGGLTAQQKDILNLFDNAPNVSEAGIVQEDVDELNVTGIRRSLLRFERAVNKNQDQRSKYPDDPSKFIESEADLDSALKSLLPLAQVATLSYPELLRSGSVQRLVGLLSHENIDIVVDAIELLNELTDEDVNDDVGDAEVDERNEREEALRELVEAFIENSLPELLTSNLTRLNESEESDRQGVFHILGISENILGLNPALAIHFAKNTPIVKWSIQRILAKDHDENRCYAAEILSILLQTNSEVRGVFGQEGGVDSLLRVSSQFRKRDPVDPDETEFMDNIFDTLCSSLNVQSNKKLFAESEGTDLMVLMLRKRLQCRSRAVKVLDHALSTESGSSNCIAFIEASGLKWLYQVFMGGAKAPRSKSGLTPASDDTAHCLGIFGSLFSNLASESIERIRLLAKFVESDYAMVDRLLEVREGAARRLKLVDQEIESQKMTDAGGQVDVTEQEDVYYLKRLDGGLYTLQAADYILAWVAMEDDGIRLHLESMLSRLSMSLRDIANVLNQQLESMDGDLDTVEAMQRTILKGLVDYLKGYD